MTPSPSRHAASRSEGLEGTPSRRRCLYTNIIPKTYTGFLCYAAHAFAGYGPTTLARVISARSQVRFPTSQFWAWRNNRRTPSSIGLAEGAGFEFQDAPLPGEHTLTPHRGAVARPRGCVPEASGGVRAFFAQLIRLSAQSPSSQLASALCGGAAKAEKGPLAVGGVYIPI